MKYSIVIPTYNHCDDLLKPCIESVIQYSNMSEVELIVSANGCIDSTKLYLDNLQIQFNELGLHNNLKVIWNDAPLGYPKATNLGIEQAVGKYVILLNNDTEILHSVKSHWLAMLEAPFLSNEKMAVTGPMVQYHLQLDSAGVVFYCAMIKRELFDTLGLLDEIYSPGGNEDHDFCLLARLAGYDLSDTGHDYFPLIHKNNQTFKELTNHAYSHNNQRFIDKFKKLRPVKYSIVIPTYNHCDDLLKPCIDSIIAYTDISQIEVIIVANGCTDNTHEYATQLNQTYVVEYLRRPFKLIWINEAIGYTRATNIGINAAKGEYIILLNNDVEILPSAKNQWLDVLEEPFSDKRTAISGPLVLHDPDIQSNFIVFFCAMISREIFDSIGLLDEIFNPGYGEDIDFAMRAKLAGYTIALVGEDPGKNVRLTTMPIWHKNNKTFGEMAEYGSIIERNQKILKDRYNKIQETPNMSSELQPNKLPMRILCSIATKGRYDTTLPSAIQSVIFQTKKVDKLIIYDDNDEPKDLREIQLYQYLFQMLDLKNIEWECVYAKKLGQHHSHQMANTAGYNWVWRIDDDCVAEPTTLETLVSYVTDEVGAVGGSVLTPPFPSVQATGKIENLDLEPSIQWDYISNVQEVDHLHCSFLYRAGIEDYNLGLSKVAHREETLFTYGLKKRGYKILVVPSAVTWHLRNKIGGIRTGVQEMFEHDEHIFRNTVQLADRTIVVLDNGMGDHVVFKKILPEINNPVIFSCFPDIVPGRSIQEAKNLFGNIDQYSVYAKMDQWNWQGSLEAAFRKLYIK